MSKITVNTWWNVNKSCKHFETSSKQHNYIWKMEIWKRKMRQHCLRDTLKCAYSTKPYVLLYHRIYYILLRVILRRHRTTIQHVHIYNIMMMIYTSFISLSISCNMHRDIAVCVYTNMWCVRRIYTVFNTNGTSSRFFSFFLFFLTSTILFPKWLCTVHHILFIWFQLHALLNVYWLIQAL